MQHTITTVEPPNINVHGEIDLPSFEMVTLHSNALGDMLEAHTVSTCKSKPTLLLNTGSNQVGALGVQPWQPRAT